MPGALYGVGRRYGIMILCLPALIPLPFSCILLTLLSQIYIGGIQPRGWKMVMQAFRVQKLWSVQCLFAYKTDRSTWPSKNAFSTPELNGSNGGRFWGDFSARFPVGELQPLVTFHPYSTSQTKVIAYIMVSCCRKYSNDWTSSEGVGITGVGNSGAFWFSYLELGLRLALVLLSPYPGEGILDVAKGRLIWLISGGIVDTVVWFARFSDELLLFFLFLSLSLARITTSWAFCSINISFTQTFTLGRQFQTRVDGVGVLFCTLARHAIADSLLQLGDPLLP